MARILESDRRERAFPERSENTSAAGKEPRATGGSENTGAAGKEPRATKGSENSLERSETISVAGGKFPERAIGRASKSLVERQRGGASGKDLECAEGRTRLRVSPSVSKEAPQARLLRGRRGAAERQPRRAAQARFRSGALPGRASIRRFRRPPVESRCVDARLSDAIAGWPSSSRLSSAERTLVSA